MDLAGGRAVHGRSGRRSDYRPLRSRLGGGPETDRSDPVDLLALYRRTLRPISIYLADLDRLEGRGDNDALVIRLARSAPGIRFLWDGGLATEADLARAPALANLLPVVGTETLACRPI
jgi:phosphoribosylformimino-5-aminoimidazole carboxamide ribotide isomerase